MPENQKSSKQISIAQKIMYIAGAIAAIGSSIVGFKTIKAEVHNFIHDEVRKVVKDDVEMFSDTVISISKRLDDHIKEKNDSFSIGLRMHKNGILYYKAEDGKEYPAYKDQEMTNLYSYPYFYYINPTTGRREWCK